MKSLTRVLLCSTATTVLPAFSAGFLLPSQAAAQTACSGTLTLTAREITCLDGTAEVAVGTTETSTVIVPTAQGLATTSLFGEVVNLTPGADGDTISTDIAGAHALNLQSAQALQLNAPDINLVTTANNSVGLILTGTVLYPSTIGNISTSGDVSDGVRVTANRIGLTTGDVSTTGADANAIELNGGTELTSITTGNLSATGAGSQGLVSVSNGEFVGNLGNVTAANAGVTVDAGAGSIDLETGSVSTTEDFAQAVTLTAGGDIRFEGGALSTAGESADVLVATSGGALTAAADGITATGDLSDGAVLFANGDLTADIGPISVAGDDGSGIIAQSATGRILINASNIATGGATFSDAIDVTGTDSITVNAGNLTTVGDFSNGVIVNGGAGPIAVNVADVQTSGADSEGVEVYGTGGIDVLTGNITTTGDGSEGLLLSGGTDHVRAEFLDIATSGVGSTGVDITTAGDVEVEGGNVSTTADGTNAVQLTGNMITGVLGGLSASGVGSQALIVNASADVGLTVGDVTSSQDAIVVTSPTAVDLTTGNVNTTEADAPGITVTSPDMINVTALNVNTDGDNSTGVIINGGAGDVTLTTAG
ncbi:MAG: beta strand repeat-containing protein, partial [Sphingomicrobium sp.]